MPSLMHLALVEVCVLVETWVLVFIFITWCSSFSLTRQHPCHYCLATLRVEGSYEIELFSEGASKNRRYIRVKPPTNRRFSCEEGTVTEHYQVNAGLVS